MEQIRDELPPVPLQITLTNFEVGEDSPDFVTLDLEPWYEVGAIVRWQGEITDFESHAAYPGSHVGVVDLFDHRSSKRLTLVSLSGIDERGTPTDVTFQAVGTGSGSRRESTLVAIRKEDEKLVMRKTIFLTQNFLDNPTSANKDIAVMFAVQTAGHFDFYHLVTSIDVDATNKVRQRYTITQVKPPQFNGKEMEQLIIR